MSLQGTLKTIGITEVLEFLAQREATGQLDVTTEMGTATYLFQHGDVAQSEYSFMRESGSDPAVATYYVVSELDGTFFFDENQVPVEGAETETVPLILSRTAEVAEHWMEIEESIPTPNHLLVRNTELLASVTIEPQWWTVIDVIGDGKTTLEIAAETNQGLLETSVLVLAMTKAGLLNTERIDPLSLELPDLGVEETAGHEATVGGISGADAVLVESPAEVVPETAFELAVEPLAAPTPAPARSVEAQPAASAPFEQAPVAAAPVEQAPFAAAPVEAQPAASAPFEPAPFEQAPVAAAPVEQAPVAAAPVEQAPFAAAPVETQPAASAPFEPAPFEPAPFMATPFASPVTSEQSLAENFAPAFDAPATEPTPAPIEAVAPAPAPIAPAPEAPAPVAAAPESPASSMPSQQIAPSPAAAPTAPPGMNGTAIDDTAIDDTAIDDTALDDDDGWATNHSPSYDAVAGTPSAVVPGPAPAAIPTPMPQPMHNVAPQPLQAFGSVPQQAAPSEPTAVAGEVLNDLAALSDNLETPSADDSNWALDETFASESQEAAAPPVDANPFGALDTLLQHEEGDADRGTVMKFLRGS